MEVYRHANWNGTTCYWLGQRRSKDGANNSTYLCLLRIIQFLSRLCNIFLPRSIALKDCHLMMTSEKHFILPFQKYPKNCEFDETEWCEFGQTLIKYDFLESRLPKYFSGNIFLWWWANYTQSFSNFHCQKLPSSNILKQVDVCHSNLLSQSCWPVWS